METSEYLNASDYAILLTYYDVYLALFYFSYKHFISKELHSKTIKFNYLEFASKKIALFTVVSSLIIIIGYIYKINSAQYYTLGISYSRSFVENLLINYMVLQYAILFLLINLGNFKSYKYYILALIIILFILIEALLSTSKAPIFYLIILYMFIKNYQKKPISPSLVAFGIFAGISFYFYSYTARYSGIAFEAGNDISSISNIVKTTIDDYSVYSEMIGEAIFNRFELFDNLIVLHDRYEIIDRGIYSFGSIVEVINLMPKIFWDDRPTPIFNVFVQYYIIGSLMDNVTMSIGRIGEAYYLLKYLGVLFAIFYGYLFSTTFAKMFIKSRSPIAKIMYINLFFSYFIQDNCLFQGFSSLVFTNVMMYLVYKASNSFFLNNGKLASKNFNV